jgi:hypothetical protein
MSIYLTQGISYVYAVLGATNNYRYCTIHCRPTWAHHLERIMNAAPEWAWGLAFFAVIVAGLLFVALSDPIYSRILGQQRTRVGSTIIVGLISGIIVGAGWWFFVLPYPLPIQEPEKGRLSIIYNESDRYYYVISGESITPQTTPRLIRVAITANQDIRHVQLKLERTSPTGPEDPRRAYWGHAFRFSHFPKKETIDCFKDVPQFVDIAVHDTRIDPNFFTLQFQGLEKLVGWDIALHLVAVGEGVKSERATFQLLIKDGRPHARLYKSGSN